MLQMSHAGRPLFFRVIRLSVLEMPREAVSSHRHPVEGKDPIKGGCCPPASLAPATGRIGIKVPCWFYQRRKPLSNLLHPWSRFVITDLALSF